MSAVFFTCILVLAVSLSALAIEISGGYLNGTIDIGDSAVVEDGSGLTLSGQMGLPGPLGIVANYTSLSTNVGLVYFKEISPKPITVTQLPAPSDDGGRFSYVDFGVTCNLPIPFVDLKVFGTYAIGKVSNVSGEMEGGIMYKGPVAGIVGKMPLGEKLTITGSYGLGIGPEVGQYIEDEFTAAPDYVAASMAAYRLGATYKVMPGVSLEAGYAGFSYGWKDEEYVEDETEKMSGFFLGARASF